MGGRPGLLLLIRANSCWSQPSVGYRAALVREAADKRFDGLPKKIEAELQVFDARRPVALNARRSGTLERTRHRVKAALRPAGHATLSRLPTTARQPPTTS